jgi:hypothetical protein
MTLENSASDDSVIEIMKLFDFADFEQRERNDRYKHFECYLIEEIKRIDSIA